MVSEIKDKIFLPTFNINTKLQFGINCRDNRVTGLTHEYSAKIRDISILTECHPEQPTIPYPDAGESYNKTELYLAQVSAIEKHCHCKIPEYALLVRNLLLNLGLMLNHYTFFISLARTTQFPLLLKNATRARALIQSMFKLIDDHKPLDKFFIIGGIATDLPSGFIEILQKIMPGFNPINAYIGRQLYRRTLFRDQLKDIGVIRTEDAIRYQLTGPNYYATLAQSPYLPEIDTYLSKAIEKHPIKQKSFNSTSGDAWHRVLIRLLEIEHAIHTISEIVSALLKTDIWLSIPATFHDRESEFSMKMPGTEGIIQSRITKSSHHYYFTGRHQFSTINTVQYIDNIINNERLSSVKIILASLNINPLLHHLKQ